MPREKNPLPKPTQLLFISTWREFLSQSCVFCEEYWKIFIAELQEEDSTPENNKHLEAIEYWRNRFRECYRLELPKSVGAAAVFRREFVRVVAAALPESGINLPYDDDPVETAIAKSPDYIGMIQIALEDVRAARMAAQNVRPEWGINEQTDLSTVLEHLLHAYNDRLSRFEELTQLKIDELSFKSFSDLSLIPIPTNPVFKVIIQALMHSELRELPEDELRSSDIDETFWRGCIFDTGETAEGRAIGAIGFKNEAEANYEFLKDNKSLAIKAHFALWVRACLETRATANRYITVTLSQFCDDLGYVRKNGAYRAASKKAAVSSIELLTSLKMVGSYYLPETKEPKEINDYIWKRGTILESLAGYEDVFNTEIDPYVEGWFPKAFSYAVGEPLISNTFEESPHITMAVLNLLRLSAENRNKYAIILGAYLGVISRLDGTTPTVIKVQTLLEAIGLWETPERMKNPSRVEDYLEYALDRLSAVGIIKGWRYKKKHDGERYDDWYKSFVTITWPDQPAKKLTT